MVKKKDVTEERLETVESALSKTEHFIEENQKTITYVVGGLILIVLLFFAYQRYIMMPKEDKAQKAMYQAEAYFGQDSLDLALNGDGGNYGFLDIIEEYGSTEAGNLARYYAGVCYLHKREFEKAIDYLEDFSSDDEYISCMALGAIGDAYIELGNFDKGIKYYLKAAHHRENEMTTPAFLTKAGWAYEISGDYRKALEVYQEIQRNYFKTREARDIDKYIARMKAKLSEL
ncbi:MAG: hypothetical protein Kow00127_00940 [Bacteroidales bacterium]